MEVGGEVEGVVVCSAALADYGISGSQDPRGKGYRDLQVEPEDWMNRIRFCVPAHPAGKGVWTRRWRAR